MIPAMTNGKDAGGLSGPAAAALALGAVAGFAGVIVAAWAAHGAAPEMRLGLMTAAHFALLHGLALIACALIHDRLPGRRVARALIAAAGIAFTAGIALFSGGIVLAANGFNPGTQPTGGTLLMGGWALLAAAALAALKRR